MLMREDAVDASLRNTLIAVSHSASLSLRGKMETRVSNSGGGGGQIEGEF